MKRFCIVLLFLGSVLPSFGWGKLGHMTIAQIAWDHMTPKARKAVAAEIDRMPIMAVATDADRYRGVWTQELGFAPSNVEEIRPKVAYMRGFDYNQPPQIEPFSHTIEIDAKGHIARTNRDGDRYIHNMAWQADSLARCLKKGGMSAEERFRAVALIVHFFGDMHCPGQIVYEDIPYPLGHFKVHYKESILNFHTVWDTYVFDIYPGGFVDLARVADTRTRREIKEITAGDIYDWAEASARDCKPAMQEYLPSEPGAVVELPRDFSHAHRALALQQVRNGGYRLAAFLNEIFN